MSIRNLNALLHPNAVALIGASTKPHSVGLVTAENLIAGGFSGAIMPVNPKYKEVVGVTAYPDIASLPYAPDLAVICTPPSTIPSLIAELAARGTKAAIVITAGFGEMGSDAGRALQQAMLAAARPHLLRIIGPNCLGVLSTCVGLNASFAPMNAIKGDIAFVAQSGAMVTTVLDWATSRGVGFSHLVSLGDMADVDFGDMLDYLATDPATGAIILYIEAVTSARKFLSAARAASRLKPVVAIKAGRHQEAAKAATSHTGALAGIDAVYDAAFRRAGILRVLDLEEVFDAVETLAMAPHVKTNDLVILTNGGGAGVLATDALLDLGGTLGALSSATLAKLDAILPPTWSHSNPVDIIGDAPPERYTAALKTLLGAPETNAVLAINCPTAIASSVDAATAVANTAAAQKKAVLANWLGSESASAARAQFAAAHIPAYATPTEAAHGFMHLVRYAEGQKAIIEVPSSVATDFKPDEMGGRDIVARALASGEGWLGLDKVAGLLGCYGIACARSAFAASPEEAVALAKKFGTVALKIVSPDIVHKSEAGGVMLDLATPHAVKDGAGAMLARIRQTLPKARIDGFLVQEMIHRASAYELIAGMAVDRQFGPFLLFGKGGTAVEVINDKALALPPLNLSLAHDLIRQTRIYRQLKGYRDRPPVALNELALTLVKLSQLVCDIGEIIEVDLNPLLADENGVIAVDARIKLARASGNSRLAIEPYPKQWERTEIHPLLGTLHLRPIKPEDATALTELIGKLTPEDARLRFFTAVKSLDPRALARFTQIDYDREMAFVLQHDSEPGSLLAVVRLAADPDNFVAEFAIIVRSDLHRKSLGRLLMTQLIDYARQRGLSELVGDILIENIAMLTLARQLGFAIRPTNDPNVLRAVLTLPPQ